ncbi:hypothetical protein [Kitasatospora sp. NPDC059827]|uniref:hypothetical protein n=1 Tax=Kitasatospora sp. NPDC059827 TaxID=3346964 RepID=UPI00365985ED
MEPRLRGSRHLSLYRAGFTELLHEAALGDAIRPADTARVSELEALGMVWSKHANAWERGHAYPRA